MEKEGFSHTNQDTKTGDDITLNLKEMTGETTILTVNPNIKIKELKNQFLNKINKKQNIFVTLYHEGKLLSDNKKISDYDIAEDETMHVLIRLQGGK